MKVPAEQRNRKPLQAVLLLASFFLLACDSGPGPAARKQPGPDLAYLADVAKLRQMDRDAEKLFAQGKGDDAATLIQAGEPVAAKVLAVPHPTLEATEAAADLDELYGKMLFSNKRYGWARLQFQKNVVRWKYWKPQTPETARRLQAALAQIADCDRRIVQ